MTSKQPPTSWQAFTTLIPHFYDLAQYVVERIDTYRPHLLLGLAHSGWLPVLAARALWEMQHNDPFPPSLRLNFGQEKLDPHIALWGETEHNDLGLSRAPDPFLAHVLWWAGQQTQWRHELVQMVTAVLPPNQTPRRILVVDEGFMEGTTYWPLLGLLSTVYPDAQIQFVAGQLLYWGRKATDAWLERHAPDTLNQLQKTVEQLEAHSDQRRQLRDALRWVATNTEDEDPYSLHCAPIHKDSQSIRLLTPYLPATTWLQIAPWAEQIILDGVRQAAIKQPKPLSPTARQRLTFKEHGDLPLSITLIYRMWQQGSLARRDVAAWGKLSPQQASQQLHLLFHRGEIAAQGWGSGTRYVPDPVYRPEFAETCGGPEANAYWVLPGRLLAGPHPLTEEGYRATAYEELDWLYDQGVDLLLDLAGRVKFNWHHGGDTAAHLDSYAAEKQFRFSRVMQPWTQYETPTLDQIHHLLETTTAALAAGRTVYLYSYRGTGRAALAAAAVLVAQGLTPSAAWAYLCQQWAKTAWGTYRRLPDTEGQRRLLLHLDKLLDAGNQL